MQKQKQNPPASPEASVLDQKWRTEVMMCGYTAVPDLLLEHMGELGLTPTELVVMLQVMRFWWRADQLPFPSKRTLARAMGMTDKNVQKVLGRLHGKGWMKRVMRRRAHDRSESNRYDFAVLVEELQWRAAYTLACRAMDQVDEDGLIGFYEWRTRFSGTQFASVEEINRSVLRVAATATQPGSTAGPPPARA